MRSFLSSSMYLCVCSCSCFCSVFIGTLMLTLSFLLSSEQISFKFIRYKCANSVNLSVAKTDTPSPLCYDLPIRMHMYHLIITSNSNTLIQTCLLYPKLRLTEVWRSMLEPSSDVSHTWPIEKKNHLPKHCKFVLNSVFLA